MRHGLENLSSRKRWSVAALAIAVLLAGILIMRESRRPPADAPGPPPAPVATAPDTSSRQPETPRPTREPDVTAGLSTPAPAPPSSKTKSAGETSPKLRREPPPISKSEPQISAPSHLQPARSLADLSAAAPAATSPESPRASEEPRAPPIDAKTVTPIFDSELRAVEDVLARYQQLYNRLDAKAATAIWPSVDTQALNRTFAQLERLTLNFDECSIVVADSTATARCVGQLEYVPRVGNNRPRTERHAWTIQFVRGGDGWHIVKIAGK